MQVYNIANSVIEASFTVDLCAALAAHTSVEPVLVSLFQPPDLNHQTNFRVQQLDHDAGLSHRLNFVRQQARKHNIVHTHHNRSAAATAITMLGSETPLVATDHNAHPGYHPASRALNGVTLPLADAVVCVSDSVRDSFARWERCIIDEEKIHVIYNGAPLERLDDRPHIDMDVRAEYGIDTDSILVGSAGMHTEQKGYDVLIRAIGLTNERSDRSVELILPGAGPLTDELKQLTVALGLEDSVHFTGFLPTKGHVYEVMTAVDLFAMPSRWEGHSVAALEAMALGTPCLVSDIPSFTTVYSDAVSFHRVDDPEHLAEQIVTLASDAERRAELGERGRAVVESRFSMERTARRYEQLYTQLQQR